MKKGPMIAGLALVAAGLLTDAWAQAPTSVAVQKNKPELSDKVAQEAMRPAEEQREDKQDQKKSGKEKPRKMVLKVDLWGNLRLVPEEPGC
jgi:hypothetical protein